LYKLAFQSHTSFCCRASAVRPWTDAKALPTKDVIEQSDFHSTERQRLKSEPASVPK